MAISASAIWEVRPSVGSDNNGGSFDTSQTAGMAADGAATSATSSSPVFTSASYSFVSGDVGAWLFIASGTNWIPGYYQIASVSGGAATLAAGAGAALYPQQYYFIASTAQGVSSTSSPSGATWSIDRSQSNSAYQNHSDLAGASGNKVSSASHTFTIADVGNGLSITAGTSFTTGYYTIVSVSSGSAVLDRNPGSSGTAGTYFLGGALATITSIQNGFVVANENWIYVKASGTISATLSGSGSMYLEFDGGRATSMSLIGYSSFRSDQGQVSINLNLSSSAQFLLGGNLGAAVGGDAGFIMANFSLSQSGGSGNSYGFVSSGSGCGSVIFDNCFFSGFTQVWVMAVNQLTFINSQFSNITDDAIIPGNANSNTVAIGCYFQNCGSGVTNTSFGNVGSITCLFCVFYNGGYGIKLITGQIASSTQLLSVINCAFVDNAHDGINTHSFSTAFSQGVNLVNNIFWGNGGWGINGDALPNFLCGRNNAFGSNASGNRNNYGVLQGDLLLTANPFANPSASDFLLNSIAGGGNLCKSAGYQSTLIA